MIAPGKRLVLTSELAKFSAEFPTVSNKIGPLGFSLGNNGDYIGLYNVKGDPHVAFYYDDHSPWPLTPDGLGFTLESTGSTANLALGSSWFAGCLGGSPGGAYVASCILSTEENQRTENIINVYPNPARNYVNVEIQSASSYTEWKLINPQGIELSRKEIVNGTSTEKIELNGLPSGLYTIIFYGENSRIVKKVVIQ
jgi:hypothetical protein